MKLIKIYSLLLILMMTVSACEEMLNPVNDYHSTYDRVLADPIWANGVLMKAYSQIPKNSLGVNDVATDDAVTNDKFNVFLRMATGEWTSIFNPVSSWDNSLSAILYLNEFLSIVNVIEWKWTNPSLNELFTRRLTGEAYGLRALFKYHLLATTGGVGSNGQLLGIPIYNDFIKPTDDFNVPRAGFAESVADIYADLDKSLEYLTMNDFKDITSGALPSGYETYSYSDYNTVFGTRQTQLLCGRAVKAVKARVALLAASPAFSNGDVALWEKAADNAAASIEALGGLGNMDPDGHRFYVHWLADDINLSQGRDQGETLWRTANGNSRHRETDNFPPSQYGNGRINPTQNLVDAFPMVNGYPIDHASSGYNEADPYAGRDPRLALYICYNGNKVRNITITTGVGGGTDAKDSVATSTRTGYYLKKLLRDDVNVNPVSPSSKKHYDVIIRYTEIFLIYAEAANEAWGPDGTGANAYSARDVVTAIRQRAGIAQPDDYLSSITTKEDMRELIRNERRLELCFEGFRFWDLRRWKADLTETAKGININRTSTVHTVVDVESRTYDNNYMIYGPVPYSEVLKYSSLIQNKDW